MKALARALRALSSRKSILVLALVATSPALAERRLALVVGQDAYPAAPLATAANDAGLVAESLRAAGFEVTGVHDADQSTLRQALRDFTGAASQAGQDSVTFVYLAGRGLQFEGENYFAPVDARISRDVDVPSEAVRLSDFTRAFQNIPGKARFFVLDAARVNPFPRGGQPIAGGLAMVEAAPQTLIAFNAAPGTAAPDEKGPYGVYATALAETLREGGVPADQMFERVRLKVADVTRGAQAPWHVSAMKQQFTLLERAPGAPALPPLPGERTGSTSTPAQAFATAVRRDTIPAYQNFIRVYPQDPLAKRARAMLAARREAATWAGSVRADKPEAYWTYLRRYPKGPHAADARRRLTRLSAQLEPPPRYVEYVYDVPPPPAEEYIYWERREVIVFEDIDAAPPPRGFYRDAGYDWRPPPPPPPQGPGLLPIPIPIPLGGVSRVPAAVAPPPPVGTLQQPAWRGRGGAPSLTPSAPAQQGAAPPAPSAAGTTAPAPAAAAPTAPAAGPMTQPLPGAQPAPTPPASGPMSGKPAATTPPPSPPAASGAPVAPGAAKPAASPAESKTAPVVAPKPIPATDPKPAPDTQQKPAPSAEPRPAPMVQPKPAAAPRPAPAAEPRPPSPAPVKPPPQESKPAPIPSQERPAPAPKPAAAPEPAPKPVARPEPAATPPAARGGEGAAPRRGPMCGGPNQPPC